MAKHTVQIIDPFQYRINISNYPAFAEAVARRPNLFSSARKLLAENLYNEANSDFTSQLRDYQLLMKEWTSSRREIPDLRQDAGRLLSDLEIYHQFFKELGAALKFNILSGRESVRQIRETLIILLHQYLSLIRPKVVYRLVNLMSDESGLHCRGKNIRFQSRELSEFIRKSCEVPENDISSDQTKPAGKFSEITAVLYVVTIGSGIDNQAKALSEAGEIFEAYILNGIGGAAAEMTALDFNLYVNEKLMASRGGGRYRRFSPGYGDWRLEEQQRIFALLKPEDKIGVRLNENNLMIPEKSTSGIMLPGVFTDQ